MLQFLCFGRLDTEKGRDAIIAMLEHFADTENKTLPFVLHIFGKGSYENKIIDLAKQFPIHIIYYGFQPLDVIKQTAKQCDYCLMPSVFLETFGLSAVNALARGLPVIGQQKGGMAPFVLDTYNLGSDTGSLDVHLVAMMEKMIKQGRHDDSEKCKNIAKKYSKKVWVNNFNTLCCGDTKIATSSRSPAGLLAKTVGNVGGMTARGQNKSKKILLVTDFIDKLGGIETYVHDVAALLQEQGHTVEIIGSSGGKRRVGRIISMFFSVYNIMFAYKLRTKIQQLQPDIIWCHSVLRNIGRAGLQAINQSAARKWMMYHDLGYFHPFPHAVTDERQIPASLEWQDFSGSIHNPVTKFLVWGKWLLLKKIQKQLRHFDQHLVPSQFMEDLVCKNYGDNVTTLPHFIQE